MRTKDKLKIYGKPVMGRPRKMENPVNKNVCFEKLHVDAIKQEAAKQGITDADYIRLVVEKDLSRKKLI